MSIIKSGIVQNESIVSLTETYLQKTRTREADPIVDQMEKCLANPPINPECPKESDARQLAQSIIYGW